MSFCARRSHGTGRKNLVRTIEMASASAASSDLKRVADGADGASKKSKSEASSSSSSAAQKLDYLPGFGAEHSSEALAGALPPSQNTPQKCPYGLIAEQLSGTSFTTPRLKNQRSWLYRVRPSAQHSPFRPAPHLNRLLRANFERERVDPNQLRWSPFALPAEDASVDWVEGLASLCGSGSPELKNGVAIHVYACNRSMVDRAFCNSDGDMLIVPQQGALTVRTEFGVMLVAPGEMCIVQRGMRFAVGVDGASRGYVCEIFQAHFVLPDLGPIGAHTRPDVSIYTLNGLQFLAFSFHSCQFTIRGWSCFAGSNGLADPRHFLHPTAAYEKRECEFVLVQKFLGELFEAEMAHSCFDVVAWHGNYVPYKYDLSLFCVVNSVLFDHLDPSIFTVLTAQTNEPGVAVCDFVIFPPRWAVQVGFSGSSGR